MLTFNNSNAFSKIDQGTGGKVKKIIPSSSAQFWTFLIFEIPSLTCTIFLLYHLLFNPKLRKALHNHVIIIFLLLTLCIEILDNPLYIDTFRFGGYKNSFSMSIPVCLMWWFIDYGFYGALSVFLAWASIERHILVFHSRQLLGTQRQRFFIHYLPLIIISIYLLGFYIGVIFFPPCQNTYDFHFIGCGWSPCYRKVSYLNIWDYLVNGIICTLIETTFSATLIIRVLWRKRRIHQRVNWRKHRKMAFQLLSISFLSLTIIVPQSLITVIEQVGGTELSELVAAIDSYLFYLHSFVVFLLPFISLGYFSELWPKFSFFKSQRQQTISTITPMIDWGQSIPPQSRLT